MTGGGAPWSPGGPALAKIAGARRARRNLVPCGLSVPAVVSMRYASCGEWPVLKAKFPSDVEKTTLRALSGLERRNWSSLIEDLEKTTRSVSSRNVNRAWQQGTSFVSASVASQSQAFGDEASVRTGQGNSNFESSATAGFAVRNRSVREDPPLSNEGRIPGVARVVPAFEVRAFLRPAAFPRAGARVERCLRHRPERRRQLVQAIDVCDRTLPARQCAVEFRHRLRKAWIDIVQPNSDDARPGQREPLKFDSSSGAAFDLDACRFEHEAHRIHDDLVDRERGGRLPPQPGADFAKAFAIGRHGFEAAHQNVEQPLAWTFVCQLFAVLRQDGAIDATGEAGQNRALGRESVAKVGVRDAGRLADVADRDVLETLPARELHQRIDDLPTRIGGFGFALRPGRHGGAPRCIDDGSLSRDSLFDQRAEVSLGVITIGATITTVTAAFIQLVPLAADLARARLGALALDLGERQ